MRWAVVVALAGCGRFGFGDAAAIDAAPVADVALDITADAAGSDTVFFMGFDDDPSDGVIDDTSGHGFAAICVAGISCPTTVAGKRGMGLQFNGTSQYALIPYQPALATNQFTVALWVYLDAQFDQVAIGKPVGSSSNDSWALVAWSVANMMTCLETTSATLENWACAPSALPTGTWFHLTGVWNGTLKRIYINGAPAGSFAGTGMDLDTHDIVLGGDQNSGSLAYAWHGRLDELRYYDRVLTQAEITALAAP